MTIDHVLVKVDPESSRFTRKSDGWLREQESLRNDLERALGPGVVQEGSPEAGEKGLPLVPIIVALSGAHFFQSLARAFEAWLKYRPGERSLTLTATVDGKEISAHITITNASVGALEGVLQAFVQTLGDALKGPGA